MASVAAKQAVMAFVARSEGGIAEIKGDTGGLTGYGISLAFLKAHSIDLNGDGVVDRGDIKVVTPEVAHDLMHKYFWVPMHCDALPDALAIAVYDSAVNQGCGYAAKALQRACKVTADGKIGKSTMAACHADTVAVLREFLVDRMFRYISVKMWESCKLGWTRRLVGCAVLAGRFM